MSFKKKLILSYVLIVTLFMAVISFLLMTQSKLGGLQDEGASRFEDAEKIEKIQIRMESLYSIAADAVINRTIDEAKKELKAFEEIIKLDIAEVAKIADTEEERKAASEFGSNYNRYLALIQKDLIFEVEASKEITEKIREIDGKIDETRNITREHLEKIAKSISAEAEEADKDFDITFKNGLIYSIIFSIVIILLSVVLGFVISSKLNQTLEAVKKSLENAFEQIVLNTNQVSEAASSLSESTNEQAAAVQETSASMEEMNSMIKKTAMSATDSSKISEECSVFAKRGEESSLELANSVEEISNNNREIMEEVNSSNQKIGEVVDLINEIANKTQVINEIVFQTKLLSFNASVEAARAGEQGKGFAVVAEEVGNLATMSGGAAQEITKILNESREKVKNVVTETQRRVGDKIEAGNRTVTNGLTIARDTVNLIKEINKEVSVVNSNIQEITVASEEQSKGAEQVAQAMLQIDQSTQMNASLSQRLFNNSKNLVQQTNELSFSIKNLKEVLDGKVA